MNSDPSPSGHHWIGPILEQFEGPLVRYAQRITGDLDLARDVVQETFVRLCRQGQGAADGHLAAWLFTVCRNRALDVCRKENRMHPLSQVMAESCPSREADHDAAIERHDTADAIYKLLAGLPTNQQEVVRLKFQNGLSYKEISQVTGHTVTNVGFLLHTALKTLREKLNPNSSGVAEPS
jgi:RNA polymerase sigma factor (sigma-70 family)